MNEPIAFNFDGPGMLDAFREAIANIPAPVGRLKERAQEGLRAVLNQMPGKTTRTIPPEAYRAALEAQAAEVGVRVRNRAERRALQRKLRARNRRLARGGAA